jgi:hypothetical protein
MIICQLPGLPASERDSVVAALIPSAERRVKAIAQKRLLGSGEPTRLRLVSFVALYELISSKNLNRR